MQILQIFTILATIHKERPSTSCHGSSFRPCALLARRLRHLCPVFQKISDQQKQMICFMGDCPPSPCHPIGLVQEYLSHLFFQKTIDKSGYNYNKYQSCKCKTQPPHIILPCKSLPVDDDSPLDFSNCDDDHSPSYSPSPFIPKEDPDPITMLYASTTTLILPNPAPNTPVRKSCPKHCHPSCNISCLICSFFYYHHPSPVCQW
jgi:hypothetical protein